MEVNLHANATTTPKTRSYIQRSKRSVAELAIELGVSETTIRRWRGRGSVADRSHTPKTLTTSLSPLEQALVCELRKDLQLPLDDITEVMRRCANPKLSRSAIHRCLKRHDLSRRSKAEKPSIGRFEQAGVGFIHMDLKHLPALERRKSYAFVAIDHATRYVYLEIHLKRDAETAAGFLERFLAHFPYPVRTILTDNGSEFTDRFAVDMKDKPLNKPSGKHIFDKLCAKRGIDHRLTRAYRPQTNGLVERFNRRIVDAIGREPKRGNAHRLFASHADRDAFLNRFVYDYNRTRLKCLEYLAPLQALSNLPGPNTFAGGGGLRRDRSPKKRLCRGLQVSVRAPKCRSQASSSTAANIMDHLKFVALDAEDLEVVSAHLQDANVRVADVLWRPQEKRLIVALDRFDWLAAESGEQSLKRCRSALRFDRVAGLKCRNVDPKAKESVLNLLAVDFLPVDGPGGVVQLIFDDDVVLRLDVECLECELVDIGEAWTVNEKPVRTEIAVKA